MIEFILRPIRFFVNFLHLLFETGVALLSVMSYVFFYIHRAITVKDSLEKELLSGRSWFWNW